MYLIVFRKQAVMDAKLKKYYLKFKNLSGCKLVSDAPYRMKEAGIPGIFFKYLSEVKYKIIDCSGRRILAWQPEFPDNFIS